MLYTYSFLAGRKRTKVRNFFLKKYCSLQFENNVYGIEQSCGNNFVFVITFCCNFAHFYGKLAENDTWRICIWKCFNLSIILYALLTGFNYSIINGVLLNNWTTDWMQNFTLQKNYGTTILLLSAFIILRQDHLLMRKAIAPLFRHVEQ